jgi:hypothetical protein
MAAPMVERKAQRRRLRPSTIRRLRYPVQEGPGRVSLSTLFVPLSEVI